MGVTVVWDNDEKTVQRYIYRGIWNWDEVHAAVTEGHRMLDTIDHKAASIVDMSGTSFVPSNAIVHLRRVFTVGGSHPNYSGLTVFLKAHPFIKAIHMMVRDTYPDSAANIEFAFASTLDEAYTIIEMQRENQRKESL